MEIVVTAQLLDSLAERILALNAANASKPIIIADKNTMAAFGEEHVRHLSEVIKASLIVFTIDLKPTLSDARIWEQLFKDAGYAIAIGSGTINDMVKYASYKADIPYIIIPTAPSMNGYTSSSASLYGDDVFKQSFPARAPVALFADIDVLSEAPIRLIQAGLGDTLCRSTVEFDCLLSHYCLGTEYNADWFSPLRLIESELINHSEKLLTRDKALIALLMDSLIKGGDAMREAGSSIPASQGEHMIAHTMEFLIDSPLSSSSSSISTSSSSPSMILSSSSLTRGSHATSTPYHGEEIAITSVSMAHIHAQMLQSIPQISCPPITNEARQYLPADTLSGYIAKQRSDAEYMEINTRLRKNWPEISAHLRAIHVVPQQLESALFAAGCPTTPEALGWHKIDYERALRIARFTRNRFTALDLY